MSILDPLRQLYHAMLSPERRDRINYLRRPSSFAVLEFPQYNDDGLATRHVPVFLKDQRFRDSYRLGKGTGALEGLHFDIEWRAHTACWCASQALKLDGDFVECGVGRGLLSRTIVAYVDFGKHQQRKFYLVDSYEGLVEEHMSEGERERKIVRKMSEIYRNNFERVSATFREFPNVIPVKGVVPDVLEQVSAEKIAYLSIDMNNAKPEIEAARYFWPKIVPGGMILLDDFVYGPEFFEQTEAFLGFAHDVGQEILALPTGQGLIIRH